ncbi:MAG: TonB-dependent receptor [Bacteroidia bacterium]
MRMFLFAAWLLLLLPGMGQDTIRGRVVDATSNYPLAGATVSAGADTVPTDAGGHFVLLLPPGGGACTIGYAGYDSLRVWLAPGTAGRTYALLPNSRQLEAVVLSAYQQGERLLQHGGSVAVIGARELDRDAPLLIAQALNRVPGVFMHNGTLNTNRITIRGIGSRTLFGTNKVRAYFDEIPLTGGDGETSIEDLDLRLLGRVEVLKGPASSLYGAGLGGTLLLHVQLPAYGEERLQAEGLGGAFGLRRLGLDYVQGGEGGQWHLHYHRLQQDGWRENSSFDRESLAVLGRVFAGERASLSVIAGLVRVKAFIPSAIDSTTFADNPQAAAFTWKKTQGYEAYDRAMGGLSYRLDLRRDLRLSASAFGTFRNNDEVRPFDILRESSQAVGGRATLRWERARVQAMAGTEVFDESYAWQTYTNVGGLGTLGPGLTDNAETRRYANVFAQAGWQPGSRTRLQAGLNVNATRYDYTDRFTANSIDRSGSYAFAPRWSPRLALTHLLGRQIAWHLSAAHGFSPPSVAETLTPEGLLNPDIQPETGWNFETGLRGRTAQDRLFFDLSIYSLQVRNLLVPRRVDNDAYVGRNAGRTRHDGLELALDYRLVARERLRLGIFAAYHYARYRFVSFSDEALGQTYDGKVLTGVPPHTLDAGLDLEGPGGLYGSLNLRWVDRMPMRDDNSAWSTAYQVVNLRVGLRRTWWRHLPADLYGGINNLLDAHYAGMILVNAPAFGSAAPRYYYPALPRHAYLGLRIGWERG